LFLTNFILLSDNGKKSENHDKIAKALNSHTMLPVDQQTGAYYLNPAININGVLK